MFFSALISVLMSAGFFRFPSRPALLSLAVGFSFFVFPLPAWSAPEPAPAIVALADGSVNVGPLLSVANRQYCVEWSPDLVEWEQLPFSFMVGNGGPRAKNISLAGFSRRFFRLKYFDPSTSSSNDSDGDGLSNVDEINVSHTSPWLADTDDDTLSDTDELAAGLNPLAADDLSPPVFAIVDIMAEDGSITASGWRTEQPAPLTPHYYKAIALVAKRDKISTTADGSAENTSTTMNVRRKLLTGTATVGDNDDTGRKDVLYQEQVDYDYKAGIPFAGAGAHTEPSSWKGAFADRTKQGPLPKFYYNWYWIEQTDGPSTTGPHRSPDLSQYPGSLVASKRSWYRNTTTGAITGLALSTGTVTFEAGYTNNDGGPPSNFAHQWSDATTCKFSHPGTGVTREWTLSEPWTYADLLGLLTGPNFATLRRVELPPQSLDPTALLYQWPAGHADLRTYTFRLQRVGGGVGPGIALWQERFEPDDDPSTPENEELNPPVTRLRAHPVGLNVLQTPVFRIDPRVSNFSQLFPGDPLAAAPPSSPPPQPTPPQPAGPKHGTTTTEYPDRFRFCGDTDRNGVIEPQDEAGCAAFSFGPGSRGAILLANCDDDDGDKFPDNWPGAIPGWHNGEVKDPAHANDNPQGGTRAVAVPGTPPAWIPAAAKGDYRLNNAADLTDCGRVRLWKLAGLGENAIVRLRLTRPVRAEDGVSFESESPYFSRPKGYNNSTAAAPLKAEHRVRLFLPTKTENVAATGSVPAHTNLLPQPPDCEILGPAAGDVVTFSKTPNPGQNTHNISQLKGAHGYVEFTAEGIEPGALVDVHLEVTEGSTTYAKQRVRLKVAPFLAVSNLHPVEKVIVGEADLEVKIQNQIFRVNNQAFINFLTANAGVEVVTWPKRPPHSVKNEVYRTSDSLFVQDQYEIGYTEMPGPSGPVRMRIALDLPRKNFMNPAMHHLMADGIGVHYRLNYLVWNGGIGSQNFGGNIESVPPVLNAPGNKHYPLGRLLVGHSAAAPVNGDVIEFLKAQAIQPLLPLDLGWSDLRHVDENVVFLPTGDNGAFGLVASASDALARLSLPALSSRWISFVFYEEGSGISSFGGSRVDEFLRPSGPFSPPDPSIPFITHMDSANGPLEGLYSLLGTSTGLAMVKVPQAFGRGLTGRPACATSSVVNSLVVGNKVFLFGDEDVINANNAKEFNSLTRGVMQSQGLQVFSPPQGTYYHMDSGGAHCATNKLPSLMTMLAGDVWWLKTVSLP